MEVLGFVGLAVGLTIFAGILHPILGFIVAVYWILYFFGVIGKTD